MNTRKRLLALEPYYGGSHRAWIDGWREHSRHAIQPITLPARKWKWRMRGAAIALSERFFEDHARTQWDGLIATDLMNLAEFLALTRPAFDTIPVVLYMHENQISYPLHPEEKLDYHYAFTNLISILSATKVVFNSEYNRQEFFQGIHAILSKMPDCKPSPGRLKRLEESSLVLAPGLNLFELDVPRKEDTGPPVVLWNHRWERDKQPEVLIEALRTLEQRGIPFRAIICGERFRDAPTCLSRAGDLFGDRLLHLGCAPTRLEYARLLAQSDVVVSTATQEFFGISILEALYAGAFPVLPKRLSYPDLIPAEYHDGVFYDEEKLADRLTEVIRLAQQSKLPNLRHVAERYDWKEMIERYDALFDGPHSLSFFS